MISSLKNLEQKEAFLTQVYVDHQEVRSGYHDIILNHGYGSK